MLTKLVADKLVTCGFESDYSNQLVQLGQVIVFSKNAQTSELLSTKEKYIILIGYSIHGFS
jgi:hypothetical protein